MTARASIAALAAFALGSAAAATQNDYAYRFPIETAGTSSAWFIDLTPEIYAWVQDSALRDIEVFNADGQPVPFSRMSENEAPATREETAILPVLALPATAASAATGDLRLVIDRDANGRLRRIDAGDQAPAKPDGTRDWLVDASAFDHAIDSLVLDWTAPSAGIVAQFAIEGGDDLQSWRRIGRATVLALDQDGAHLERRDIALGGVRAKYLRLHRLDDGAALTGLVARARARERESSAPTRVWIDAAASALPLGGDTGISAGAARFDYSLPAALPVDAARIELVADNSLAPVALFAHYSGVTGDTWSRLSGLTAFRLRQGEETLRNGAIDLHPAGRLREFRIESATPLAAAPKLSLSYRPDRFVFLAEGAGPYVLAVGSASAHRADYPVSAALDSLRAKFGKDWSVPQAKLGAAERAGGHVALQPKPAPVPWRRWVLWAVLIAGAALVAGFALALLRGAGKSPD